jgi:hypothetical protein
VISRKRCNPSTAEPSLGFRAFTEDGGMGAHSTDPPVSIVPFPQFYFFLSVYFLLRRDTISLSAAQ